MIKTIKKIIFWTAIAFILLAVFSLTIGQIVPYEFADYKQSSSYYNTIMQGLPIAILLTLFVTLKEENSKTRNWIFLGMTVLTSILSFVLMVSFIFTIGFGSWITFKTMFRHKVDDKVIKDQLYDVGALGYGRHRIVELKPILKYWVLPTEVNITTINKNEWELVNKQGDIKFP